MPEKGKFRPWGKRKIKLILPHGEPFILLDKIVYAKKNKQVVATKYINKNDFFLKGHFPKAPLMPGVLIIEAMAQAAIILFSISKPYVAKSKPIYYLAKVNAEFLLPVKPDVELVVEANAVKILDDAEIVNTAARVDSRIVAKTNIVMIVKKHEK